MAQIATSIDTVTKEVAVTINGVEIPDAEYVNYYIYRDSNGNVTGLDASVEVSAMVEDVRVRVSFYASGSELCEKARAVGSLVYKEIEGFIGFIDNSEAMQDIDNFLSGQKKPF